MAKINLILVKGNTAEDITNLVITCSWSGRKGAALDARAGEYGVTRLAATSAKYYMNFEGAAPQIGERFFADGKYFILKSDSADGAHYLEAEIAGTEGNEIYPGTPAVPVNNISGLASATFGALCESGTDAEDDESLRTRIQEKIAGPAENGNKQHYKTWCESRDGIGRARIFPLWNGPNTVKAVLIDSAGQPCSASKVAEVQNFIDPATKGYTAIVDDKTYVVGDGLGEGVANIGAHFTAVAATALTINISFTAELVSGVTKEAAREEATAAIEEYFKTLALAAETDNNVVRVSAIGAIISKLETVLDYANLELNGAPKNIAPEDDDVPVIGEVQIL